MDRVTGKPRHEAGVVLLPVRIGGYRFEIGAVRPGDWTITHFDHTSADYKAAKALADAYEREHDAELALLFAAAEAFRNEHN